MPCRKGKMESMCDDRSEMSYPVIDVKATGANLRRLRVEKHLSVRELCIYLGLSDVQSVYKWQRGEALPCIDNLLALSKLLNASIEQIIITRSAV